MITATVEGMVVKAWDWQGGYRCTIVEYELAGKKWKPKVACVELEPPLKFDTGDRVRFTGTPRAEMWTPKEGEPKATLKLWDCTHELLEPAWDDQPDVKDIPF